MGSLSFTHLLLLAIILLLFFGPSRLPQLGQSLGKAIRGFKKGLSEDDDTRPVDQLQHDSKDSLSQTTTHKEKDKV